MNGVARAARRWRALLARAFRADDADLTHGSVHAAVVLLAIPMVLEMAMESVFALVDIYFVARLGAAAVAAVGLTEAVMTLVYAVAVGLGMGVTALVSPTEAACIHTSGPAGRSTLEWP